MTGLGIFAAIEVGGFDSVALVASADGLFGTSLASRIDPTLGNVAVAVTTNEVRSSNDVTVPAPISAPASCPSNDHKQNAFGHGTAIRCE